MSCSVQMYVLLALSTSKSLQQKKSLKSSLVFPWAWFRLISVAVCVLLVCTAGPLPLWIALVYGACWEQWLEELDKHDETALPAMMFSFNVLTSTGGGTFEMNERQCKLPLDAAKLSWFRVAKCWASFFGMRWEWASYARMIILHIL